jgi:Mce-associated membrane protein
MTSTSELPTEHFEDSIDADLDGTSEHVALDDAAPAPKARRDRRWARVGAFGLLPAAVMLLALAAGYLKWVDSSAREAQLAATSAVRAATDSTVAMLSYKPDSVENDLGAARDRLTGEFKDSYTSLIDDVVIPGSKQSLITSQAKVVAAAPVSANSRHAVVLVFVNQTVTMGNDPPTESASSVRVTLVNVGGRWLIAQFDPV